MRDFLRLRLAGHRNEVFGAIFLTTRLRILDTADLFQGTVDSAAVYPRVVVQRALEINASAALVFHNHVSGSPEPSSADCAITDRLKQALALVDIRLLDHIVVADSGTVSLAERGLL